jgi:hypothetical protein
MRFYKAKIILILSVLVVGLLYVPAANAGVVYDKVVAPVPPTTLV